MTGPMRKLLWSEVVFRVTAFIRRLRGTRRGIRAVRAGLPKMPTKEARVMRA